MGLELTCIKHAIHEMGCWVSVLTCTKHTIVEVFFGLGADMFKNIPKMRWILGVGLKCTKHTIVEVVFGLGADLHKTHT